MIRLFERLFRSSFEQNEEQKGEVEGEKERVKKGGRKEAVKSKNYSYKGTDAVSDSFTTHESDKL